MKLLYHSPCDNTTLLVVRRNPVHSSNSTHSTHPTLLERELGVSAVYTTCVADTQSFPFVPATRAPEERHSQICALFREESQTMALATKLAIFTALLLVSHCHGGGNEAGECCKIGSDDCIAGLGCYTCDGGQPTCQTKGGCCLNRCCIRHAGGNGASINAGLYNCNQQAALKAGCSG